MLRTALLQRIAIAIEKPVSRWLARFIAVAGSSLTACRFGLRKSSSAALAGRNRSALGRFPAGKKILNGSL